MTAHDIERIGWRDGDLEFLAPSPPKKRKWSGPLSFDELAQRLKAGEFDESKHPRNPAGSPEGGRFASADGGGGEEIKVGPSSLPPVEADGNIRATDTAMKAIFDKRGAEAAAAAGFKPVPGYLEAEQSHEVRGELKASIEERLGKALDDRYHSDDLFRAQTDAFMASAYNHDTDYADRGNLKVGAALPFVHASELLMGPTNAYMSPITGKMTEADPGPQTMEDAFRVLAADDMTHSLTDTARIMGIDREELSSRIADQEEAIGLFHRTGEAQSAALTDDDVRRYMFATMANEAVATWAQTSSDGSVASTMLQQAVGRLGGFDDEVSALHQGQIDYMGEDVPPLGSPDYAAGASYYDKLREAVADGTNRFGFMYDAIAQQVYDDTQKMFRDNGITEVTAWRGFELKGDQREELNYELDHLDRGRNGITIDPTDIVSNPLSSYAWDAHIALSFANASEGESAYMMGATVPVRNVWSTAITGPGAFHEHEMILMPYPPGSQMYIPENAYNVVSEGEGYSTALEQTH